MILIENPQVRPQLIHSFLVSHQVLYLHTMQVGRYYHYVYFHKKTQQI